MSLIIKSVVIFFLLGTNFVCLPFSKSLFAHPVIWKNGWVITSQFNDLKNEFKAHYSLTNQWAIGLHGIQFNQTNNYVMIQNNFLMKRWNASGSQGNFYVFTGFGGQLNEKDAMSHLGIQADWETRSIYTMIAINSYLKDQPMYLISARLGISPYLTDYSGLSTWFIFKIDDTIIEDEHNLSILPMLRFFKDNILIEIGSNLKDKYLFTLMIHY